MVMGQWGREELVQQDRAWGHLREGWVRGALLGGSGLGEPGAGVGGKARPGAPCLAAPQPRPGGQTPGTPRLLPWLPAPPPPRNLIGLGRCEEGRSPL